MKKIIISTIAFLLFISTNVFAQAKGTSDKDIANKLCDCIEKSFAQYPQIMRDMIVEMGEIGEEKAQQKFQAKFAKLNPKEKEKVEKAMNIEPTAALQKNCGETTKIMDKKNKGSEASAKKILSHMEKMQNCKIGVAIMKAGLKQ